MDKEKFYHVFFEVRIPDYLIGFIVNELDKELKRHPYAEMGWRKKTLDISMTSRESKLGHPQTWMTGYIIVSLEEDTMVRNGCYTYSNSPIEISPSNFHSGHELSIEIGSAAELTLKFCKINNVAEFEAKVEDVE